MTDERPEKQAEKKTILIVDDDSPLLLSLERSLVSQRPEYSVNSAMSSDEALKQFRKKKPDIVLTDIMMPGLKGFNVIEGLYLIKRLRSEDAFVPIIVLSAVCDVNTVIAALELGANDFLNKGFDREELFLVIEKHLEMTEQQRKINYYKKYNDTLLEENKRLKEQLETVSKEQGRGLVDKEIENFKSVWGLIAHGLKSEFMHIGYSTKEIQSDSSVSKDVLEASHVIARSLTYSRLLVQRLFNYLDMGTPQKETVELSALFMKLEELAKPRMPSNIKWHIQLPRELEKTVIAANQDQLTGVLLEFIHNASNALKHKGGNIAIAVERKNGDISMSVTDDGPGIPDDIKEKLFKEKIPSKSGLGLGLYLGSKVINQLGGTVSLRIEVGKGTTFSINFAASEDKKEL
jgi:DNA-binding response OmpR family regulator/two-component sensor histidine kinase